MPRLSPVICVSALLYVGKASAQVAPVTWPPLALAGSSQLYTLSPKGPLVPGPIASEKTDTLPRQIKPTYWKEGGVIGALAAGSLLAYLGYGLCTSGDTNQDGCGKALAGGALVGGGMGFLLGALLGGQFSKHLEKAPADSAQAH